MVKRRRLTPQSTNQPVTDRARPVRKTLHNHPTAILLLCNREERKITKQKENWGLKRTTTNSLSKLVTKLLKSSTLVSSSKQSTGSELLTVPSQLVLLNTSLLISAQPSLSLETTSQMRVLIHMTVTSRVSRVPCWLEVPLYSFFFSTTLFPFSFFSFHCAMRHIFCVSNAFPPRTA